MAPAESSPVKSAALHIFDIFNGAGKAQRVHRPVFALASFAAADYPG